MDENKKNKIYLDFLIDRCKPVNEESGLRGLFRQIKKFFSLVKENLGEVSNENFAKKWSFAVFLFGIWFGIVLCVIFSGLVFLIRRNKDDKVTFFKLILEFVFPSIITGLGFAIIYMLKVYSFVDLTIFLPSIVLASIIIVIINAIDFSSFLKVPQPEEDD